MVQVELGDLGDLFLWFYLEPESLRGFIRVEHWLYMRN